MNYAMERQKHEIIEPFIFSFDWIMMTLGCFVLLQTNDFFLSSKWFWCCISSKKCWAWSQRYHNYTGKNWLEKNLDYKGANVPERLWSVVPKIVVGRRHPMSKTLNLHLFHIIEINIMFLTKTKALYSSSTTFYYWLASSDFSQLKQVATVQKNRI